MCIVVATDLLILCFVCCHALFGRYQSYIWQTRPLQCLWRRGHGARQKPSASWTHGGGGRPFDTAARGKSNGHQLR